MGIISTLASVGMAVGPPLVYADQAVSIIRKKDSTGFSHVVGPSQLIYMSDVCGVLLVANIIRIYFWLGNRFELPLLVQSILLIVSQLLLLSICLHYRPFPSDDETQYTAAPMFDADADADADADNEGDADRGINRSLNDSRQQQQQQQQQRREENLEAGEDEALYESRTSPLVPSEQRFGTGPSPNTYASGSAGASLGFGKLSLANMTAKRPWDFWQWANIGTYVEFLAGLILVFGLLQIVFGRWVWYVDTIGFIALAIESTLPIPQFISNYRNKSCYGFRSSTLAGWLFGDTFKTGYFFLRNAPTQFKVTAIMTVCWDLAVLAQRIIYKADPPAGRRYNQGGGGDDDEDREESRGLRLAS